MSIKLYVPDTYRDSTLFTHTELMFPFWGVTAKESMPYVRAANVQYQYSNNDFELVANVAETDFVHAPYSYERLKSVNPSLLQRIIDDAAQAKKPLLIDGSGDLEFPIEVPNSIVFRVSQYQYAKKDNEIAVPFPAEDLLETYYGGELQLREKTEMPSVSFTGWASLSLKARIKTEIKEFPRTIASIFDSRRGAERKGLFFRARALTALGNTAGIENHFTARTTYSGHVKTITGSVVDNRREFIETLINSDYALVVKGDANASVRFYEALALGRIPLFLDTECVLPLEDRINYRDFCVFVDWKDVDLVGEKLLEFHRTCSPEQFQNMQLMARDAYRNYLRMDSFSRKLANQLRIRLA